MLYSTGWLLAICNIYFKITRKEGKVLTTKKQEMVKEVETLIP